MATDGRWKENAPVWCFQRALDAMRVNADDKPALDRAFRRLETDFGRPMATDAWAAARAMINAENGSAS
jgi:hypothetical protein